MSMRQESDPQTGAATGVVWNRREVLAAAVTACLSACGGGGGGGGGGTAQPVPPIEVPKLLLELNLTVSQE